MKLQAYMKTITGIEVGKCYKAQLAIGNVATGITDNSLLLESGEICFVLRILDNNSAGQERFLILTRGKIGFLVTFHAVYLQEVMR